MTSFKPVGEAMEALVSLLRSGRFDYADEKACQEQIAAHLVCFGVVFEREYRLKQGVVDFFFPRSGLALEIKAASTWRKTQVYRQCERYCADPQVFGLILATGKAQGLPPKINNKPVSVFQLGVGLLS